MVLLQKAIGVAALILFIVGANMMILKETLFTANVLGPILGGLVLGVAWLILWSASLLRRRQSASLGILNSIIAAIAFLGICMTLYAFLERENLSWDLTQEGRRDLATPTKLILQSLTNPVEVTCFFVRSADDRVRVAQEKTKRFLQRCAEHTDSLKVEFVDPQRNPERAEALNMLRVSDVGTIVLRSGARQREIPLSDIHARLEERDFTNALLNVSRQSIPKVYFLTGHGEHDITDSDPKDGGKNFKLWLEKEAHEVDQLLISVDNPALPDDCDVLIIDGYQSDLYAHEIRALDQFMDDGGRLLVLVNVQIVQNADQPVQEQFRPWLQSRFGINIGSDIIVSGATSSYKIMFIPDFALLGDTGNFVPPGNKFRGSFNNRHVITRDLDKQLVLSVIRSVTLDDRLPEDVSGTLLMRTTPDTWAESNLRAVVDGKPIGQDPGEVSGPNGVMVAVTAPSNRIVGDGERTRDARVVVLGDADLSMNEFINVVGNQNLLLNSVAWLTESEELIAMRPTSTIDQPLILTENQQRIVAWIASLGAVQAIALIGVAVFLIRRKYR